jgi:predicted dehydrogenase
MRLTDPYQNPTLYVRRPGSDVEERHHYADDDPFFSEISAFIDAIEGGPDPNILSTFEDAAKSYEWVEVIMWLTSGSRGRSVLRLKRSDDVGSDVRNES